MGRKRQRTLFFWGGDTSSSTGTKKIKYDSDGQEAIDYNNPQLELLTKKAKDYRDSMPLPYEMLMKIFNYVMERSENPLKDLCCLASVSESWRQIIIQSPSLWFHIDLSKVPKTDRNIATLDKVFKTMPLVDRYIKEVSFSGALECKKAKNINFIENLIAAPNLTTLKFSDLNPQRGLTTLLMRSIPQVKKLHSLSVVGSRCMFNNGKWLSDYLVENGRELETLDLALSLRTISTNLFKSFGFEYCPNLKVLDISTYDVLTTRSFDAILLSQTMPNLEVLRVANISFKRIYELPERFGLNNLRELSMPIGLRDTDRDDGLFATLTFGSDKIRSLDLRGSSISANALLDTPSYQVAELHMDDLCPFQRSKYHLAIRKWSKSLEVLSLVKINCSETMKNCLEALTSGEQEFTQIKELDLSSSDVLGEDLSNFLKKAKHLNSINLSSCRSLPRGSKGVYSRNPTDRSTHKLAELKKRLT